MRVGTRLAVLATSQKQLFYNASLKHTQSEKITQERKSPLLKVKREICSGGFLVHQGISQSA